MTGFAQDGWRLTADFPPLEWQENVIDPEYTWPGDMASRMIGAAVQQGFRLEQGGEGDIEFNDDGTSVSVCSPTLDGLRELLDYLLMSTIPIRLTIADIDPEGKPVPTVDEMPGEDE